ncbi:glutathione synthase [Stigmatella sp. ncwal1]|uniref:Glutathione synthetase n=1 Tax=Stigmatella ashevillensis TaxID=2995309 RepID=A0ABT5DGM1_9BACT|nr:glutathione synthase [Stigmatella ashevillena]MDC0711918.1 glutathione synthase [Stigmatella ashevillena]
MAPLTLGFLMDPLEHVRVDHDSTFAMMVEAHRRGHTVRYFEQGWLRFSGRCTEARMRTVSVQAEAGRHFEVRQEAVHPISSLDVLFLRKDPPVDVDFLHATQLVELCAGKSPIYINSPSALREANEKLFTLHFPDLMPETFVARELPALADFIARHPGGTILKPIDGFGGKGIVFLDQKDRNTRSMLEMLTRGGQEPIMAQAYVPQARLGDKRIILVNGEPLGAVLRVPSDDDHRGNMAAGGKPVKTVLTAREKEICARLKPVLLERGLYLVGIDVLGDYLTEVNVTSPTGLVEIDRLDGVSIESHVIDLAERLSANR